MKTKKILFFDTETTGLVDDFTPIENQPSMVQFGAILWEYEIDLVNEDVDFRIISEETIDLLFKPLKPIPQKLTDIHGISNEMVADKPEFESYAKEFVRMCREADIIVGHNLEFDKNMMFVELDRVYPSKSPEKDEFKRMFKEKSICTMQNSINFCAIKNSYGFKYPKLSELHIKLFWKDFDNAHNAAADIQATRNCFFELKRIWLINFI